MSSENGVESRKAIKRRQEPYGPAHGADPWCTWCDEDLPDEVWMLHDHDDGRWPPAFCSEDHAEAWGCAADEGEAYSVERSEVIAFDP